jgi:hypothetical protein
LHDISRKIWNFAFIRRVRKFLLVEIIILISFWININLK